MIVYALLVLMFAVVLYFLGKYYGRQVAAVKQKNQDRYVTDSFENIASGMRMGSKVALSFGVLLVLLSCIVIVQAGHVGVAVVFGSVQPSYLSEGIGLINPFAIVKQMSIRTETYTMSSVHNEGQVAGDDSIQALSSDGLLMPLDVTIAYRLVSSDAPRVFRNIGEDYVDKIIRPSSRTAVREAIAGYTAQEAYSNKREELSQAMHDGLVAKMKQLLSQRTEFSSATGFIVDQIMIRNLQLPKVVKDAIEEKLAAEQASLKMKFVLQKEQQEAERKRVEASGIRDFQKTVAEGISSQLLEWKGIEATERLAASPNAKVVIVGGKNGLPVILNP